MLMIAMLSKSLALLTVKSASVEILVVAGSVTRDKLSSGGGGNLLYNPIFPPLQTGYRMGGIDLREACGRQNRRKKMFSRS